MATEKKNALAVMENFHIAKSYEGMDEDLMAELQDEMADFEDDGGIACRTIKLPSGGGLAYIVQGDEDGDEDYLKEIQGVIVFSHQMNAYWPNAFGQSNNQEDKIPACSSMDGKTGYWPATGELRNCDTCPLNQYGTDVRGGKGKACKNMRRIYLMRDGDPNFYLLTVPPTSIKEVNRQMRKIMASKGIPYTGLVVSFKLAKATNGNGIDYSTIVMEKKGTLPPATMSLAGEMRRQIKTKYKEMSISLDDYATVPAAGSETTAAPVAETTDAEFTEAPSNDDLPFA
ncbi:MAG: hypothetical protein LUE24_04815 [Lachnospiraceae bacterium]|nr:hypothetical protein [Lachnospiraceae bacterium]